MKVTFGPLSVIEDIVDNTYGGQAAEEKKGILMYIADLCPAVDLEQCWFIRGSFMRKFESLKGNWR